MLYQLLLPTDPQAAEMYLSKGFKLVEDVMRECGTGRATLQGGKVNWGEGGWETLLKVSDGGADYARNPRSPPTQGKHGESRYEEIPEVQSHQSLAAGVLWTRLTRRISTPPSTATRRPQGG
jgi:hypothetical protein